MSVCSLNTNCDELQIGPIRWNIAAFLVMAVKSLAKIFLSVIIPHKFSYSTVCRQI